MVYTHPELAEGKSWRHIGAYAPLLCIRTSNASAHTNGWHAKDLPLWPREKGKLMDSQVAAQNQLCTPVTPAINTPTSSLPIKKRPLNKVAGRTLMQAPKEQGVNAISSDPKPEPALKDANREMAKMNGDKEEDLEEEPKEVPNVEDKGKPEEAGNGAGEHLHGEHDPVTHFANEISESIDVLANNDHLRNLRTWS
ncbi:hypothetical protein PIB30_102861 [Stylosanthes scabra]|uniref:Uncharacterized protein n=1 Tax=Stylosanthes scabra TaxID=79078 RepID=A0ABU6QX95_9FABA|nr:hypothetical protein [Stylosanthes scabra]